MISFAPIGLSALVVAVALAAVSEPSEPAWPCRNATAIVSPAGRMAEARSVQTMTVVAHGLVLIAGGMPNGGGGLRSAELFDPATNATVARLEMHAARAGHTATKLADGRVLIAGGYDGSYHASSEVFDPGTRTFTAVAAMNHARSDHTATPLADGRVLVVGGVGEGYTFLGSAEIFDPETGSWTDVGPMSVAREGHTATLLSDGRVLIIGGHRDRRENMVVYSSTELFDPKSGGFTLGPELTIPRHKHGAVGLADGRVLVVGGADRRDWRGRYPSTEIYDPKGGPARFLTGPTMGAARFKLPGAVNRLGDGTVVVAGGSHFAELLPPGGGTFCPATGDFGAEYFLSAAVPLPDGDVLIAGGYDDHGRDTDGVWRLHRTAER